MKSTLTSSYIDNNGVSIHYVARNIDDGEMPLVMIPGAVSSADDIDTQIGEGWSAPRVIVSLRGRGKSESPSTGYSLNDQAGDVVAVVRALGIGEHVLFGHSFGVPVAIRAASMLNDLQGIILGDFAPFYPPLDKSWGGSDNPRALRERDACRD